MNELKPCPFCESELKMDKFMRISNFLCHSCGAVISFRGAEDCQDAIKAINRRPTPENNPLTLDQLRQMDGEPVWIVESPNWGHWELAEDAGYYLCDRDPDFYGMKMESDPQGRYGLHLLGWLAYASKPEQEG